MKQLVVNGCSYMEGYAGGAGHVDLANILGIPNATSLAIGGSANSRILRTTLKHSYQATEPTMYIMGLTFVSRDELPILHVRDNDSFEGRWCNPQNQEFASNYEHFWNRAESERFVDFKLKTEVYSLLDRTEDLQFRILAAVADLKSRGHGVLVYQQADDSYRDLLLLPKLQYFKTVPNIIDSFGWCAIQYQHSQGVPTSEPSDTANYIGPQGTPEEIRHRANGHHAVLNNFLAAYIKENRLLNE